jgi:hypothetical protein
MRQNLARKRPSGQFAAISDAARPENDFAMALQKTVGHPR